MRPFPGRILAAVLAFAGLFLYTGCATAPVEPRPEKPVAQAPEPVKTDSPPEIFEPVTPVEVVQVPEIQPEFFHHTISWPGETLMRISAWYTNSLSNWDLILEANPKLNPKLLQLGTVVNIPVDLVKTTTPMPRSFLKTKKETQSQPDNPDTFQQKVEEMELFSPNDISPGTEAVDNMELFELPE